MEKVLAEALEIGKKHIERGNCASYIPELARADKHDLGVCVITKSCDRYTAGDTKKRFTIQSISKVISSELLNETLYWVPLYTWLYLINDSFNFNNVSLLYSYPGYGTRLAHEETYSNSLLLIIIIPLLIENIIT